MPANIANVNQPGGAAAGAAPPAPPPPPAAAAGATAAAGAAGAGGGTGAPTAAIGASSAALLALHEEGDHQRCTAENKAMLVRASLDNLRATLLQEVADDDWMYDQAPTRGDSGGAAMDALGSRAQAAQVVALAAARSQSWQQRR